MRKTVLDSVHRLAKQDPRVLFIGSDLGAGVLGAMQAEMPERFFMEGVSEAHVIGMAAGLAMEGYIPYVNTIATFITRRGFEQVALDVCLHRVPVRLIASGGGTVYAPLGPTHMAIEDIATMRALPNMTVVAPADAVEMTQFMDRTLAWPDPIYIRLAKGSDPVITQADDTFEIGRAKPMRAGGDIGFVTTGIMTGRALIAADTLAETAVESAVLHCATIKPLDTEAIIALARSVRVIVTVEEHLRAGGLGSAVLETLSDNDIHTPVLRLGLGDTYIHSYGSQNDVLVAAGLDSTSIARSARRRLESTAAGVR
jgi:transketolase